jgi:hypothetical protein
LFAVGIGDLRGSSPGATKRGRSHGAPSGIDKLLSKLLVTDGSALFFESTAEDDGGGGDDVEGETEEEDEDPAVLFPSWCAEDVV